MMYSYVIQKVIKAITPAFNRVGLKTGYVFCFGLFIVGIIGAFARFLPQDTISTCADTLLVQVVSSACLLLSGFVFAAVGVVKNDGPGKEVGKVNNSISALKSYHGAEHHGVESVTAQRQSVKADVEVDHPSVGESAAREIIKPDTSHSEPSSTKPIDYEHFDLRKIFADKVLENDTRAFLEDRLEELIIDSCMDEFQTIEWGRKAVSFIDEIRLLRAHVSPDDSRIVSKVYDQVLDKMEELGLVLIDEDAWDPSHQRAVSVLRSASANGTRILKKKSCGMSFRGKVVKKQELEVEMPFEK